MKNYDETINSVFSKIEDYNIERKRKKNFVLKTVTPLSCLCLAVVVAVCVAGNDGVKPSVAEPSAPYSSREIDGDYSALDGNQPEKNPENNIGNASNATSQPSSNVENNATSHLSDSSDVKNDPIRIMFILNKIDGEIGAAKLNFSPDKYYSEVKDANALKEYFGKDFTSLENFMPKDFAYSGNGTKNFYYEHGGKVAYDTCMFFYTKEEATIEILVSKIGAPFDCIYNHKNDITPSEINGISAIMGYKSIPVNDEAFEFVYADFSCRGLNYRIVVRDFEKSKDMGMCLYKLVYALTE